VKYVLIFPHQLFENHPSLKKNRPVILMEDRRFFSDFCFHRQKLVFHRASMKNFEKLLQKKGYPTHYLENASFHSLKQMNISTLHLAELNDLHLENEINSLAKTCKIKLEIAPNPGFITTTKEFDFFFKGKKCYRMEPFYIYQRKRLDILIEKKEKPTGGQWSYDVENRKKLPASVPIPRPYKPRTTNGVEKAIRYVKTKYPKNLGNCAPFIYPTTHSEAKKYLSDFLENRLPLFGDYEDAIIQNEKLLFQ